MANKSTQPGKMSKKLITIELEVPLLAKKTTDKNYQEAVPPAINPADDINTTKLTHKRSHSDSISAAPATKQLLSRGDHSSVDRLLFVKNGSISAASSSGLRHRICFEEIIPDSSSYLVLGTKGAEVDDVVDDSTWKSNLNAFTSQRITDKKQLKSLPRNVRRYYQEQEELIDAFENLQLNLEDDEANAEAELQIKRKAELLAKVTFFINLALLIAKSAAAGLSGSLAVISSVIDSCVDLISGLLIWWSNRAIKKRNIYSYPQGRTKLEPVSLIVLSVIMALASIQLIRESIQDIIYIALENGKGPDFGWVTIGICAGTVAIKFVLYLICCGVKNPSVQALAQDHRNDVLSNTTAIVCGIIGGKVWPYADPIGAIIISTYIIINWSMTGHQQIKLLTGHTARPDFLKKITWLALNHHPKILLIDTVRAFHFGVNFLVEVDIVLPEDLNMKESHDIGESLQLKIEKLPDVERAFVHLDYETEHHPSSEHKQV